MASDKAWAKLPVSILARIAEQKGFAAAYVYAVLRSFDDPKCPGHCYPSVRILAERAGVPERTVWRQLAALKAMGVITSERRPTGKSRGSQSNLYRFHEPTNEPKIDRTGQADQPATGDRETRPDQPATSDRVNDQTNLPGVTGCSDDQPAKSGHFTLSGVAGSFKGLTDHDQTSTTPPPAPACAREAEAPTPESLIAGRRRRRIQERAENNNGEHGRLLIEIRRCLTTCPAVLIGRALDQVEVDLSSGRDIRDVPGLFRHKLGPLVAERQKQLKARQVEDAELVASRQRQQHQQQQSQQQAQEREARQTEFLALPEETRQRLFEEALGTLNPIVRDIARQDGPLSLLVWRSIERRLRAMKGEG